MLLALSTSGDIIRLLILVLLAVVVGVYLLYLNRRRPADETLASYQTLDEETLRALPDDKLVNAVAANLLAKLDPKHPDPYHSIPLLGEARCTVYCVWLYHHTVQRDGIAALRRKRNAAFYEMAVDAYRAVGAPLCADAIEAAFSAQGTDAIALVATAYTTAAKQEKPLDACAAYIRADLTLFTDRAE